MGRSTDTVGLSELTTTTRRIGILGGTFDPIHLGHLLAAEQCREQLNLDELRFLVAATSPFKTQQRTADSKHRLEMVQLAIQANPYFRVDDRELRRGGTSYTVDTLRELKSEAPDAELVFLMGADSLVDFDKWKEPDQVCRLAHVVVVARGGHAAPNLAILQKYLREDDRVDDHVISMPVCEISSTHIRQSVAKDMSIRYQTTAAVAAYIAQHGIYGEPRA